MPETELRFLYVTVPDRALALAIGRTLVEERLAACANVTAGMRSVYRWEGRVEEADEVVMIVKTSAAAVPRVTERVLAMHPYECPCVAVLPVVGGSAPYLDWIAGQVDPSPPLK